MLCCTGAFLLAIFGSISHYADWGRIKQYRQTVHDVLYATQGGDQVCLAAEIFFSFDTAYFQKPANQGHVTRKNVSGNRNRVTFYGKLNWISRITE